VIRKTTYNVTLHAVASHEGLASFNLPQARTHLHREIVTDDCVPQDGRLCAVQIFFSNLQGSHESQASVVCFSGE